MSAVPAIPRIDPRLAWLARAAARHILVEAGEIGLDEAFDDLASSLIAIVPERMTVDQIVELWERRDPYRGPRR